MSDKLTVKFNFNGEQLIEDIKEIVGEDGEGFSYDIKDGCVFIMDSEGNDVKWFELDDYISVVK